MKKKLFVLGLSAALAAAMTVGFAACSPEEQSVVHDDIVNGGFEDAVGSLTGWTKDGNAFGASGVVNGTTSYYGDIEVGKVGENFYDGWMKNPKPAMLTCNDGFGRVSFLVEAGDEDAE